MPSSVTQSKYVVIIKCKMLLHRYLILLAILCYVSEIGNIIEPSGL